MKIAYICSGEFPCPPPENHIQAALWVTAQVVEGITARGHETTYIGVDGSTVGASHVVSMGKGFHELYPYDTWAKIPEPKRGELFENFRSKLLLFATDYLRNQKFDIVHFHVSPPPFALPFARYISGPKVFTFHDPVVSFYKGLFDVYVNPDNHYVSISLSQRAEVASIAYAANVYNGIPTDAYRFTDIPSDAFLFLGRLKQIKGVDHAIQAAIVAQQPLHIAGRPGTSDRAFVSSQVAPFVDGKTITQSGVVGKEEKMTLLGKAKALLFPIAWGEPFGLVMIEAMACGTPVIAYNRGSVAEIVQDGVTGFIVEPDDTGDSKETTGRIKKRGIAGLVEAMTRIGEIDRHACRRHVADHFTTTHMIDGYESLYKTIHI